MKKYILSLLACVVMAGAAVAQPARPDEKLPSAIALAVGGGMKFEKAFSAPGGMTGYVLSSGVDQNMVVYVTADGQAAIAGNMLDVKGQNLTKEHLAQYAPKPDYDKTWTDLEKASTVATGAKGKDVKSVIYVFEDANCIYCHLEYKALQPYTKVGLQVRWVPVAFLHADSYEKAAVFLAAKDSEAALVDMHINFGKHGAIAPASPEMRAKVDANNKLMANSGFKGTPVTFYKDKAGKVRVINGMTMLSDLPNVTGLPLQPNADPDLQRFR